MKILFSLVGLLLIWGIMTGQIVKSRNPIEYIALLLFSIFIIILPIFSAKLNKKYTVMVDTFKSLFVGFFLIFLAASIPEPSFLYLTVLFLYVSVYFIIKNILNKATLIPTLLPTIIYIMGVHFLSKSLNMVAIFLTVVVFIAIWLLPYVSYSLSKNINHRIWSIPTNPLVLSIPLLGYYIAPRIPHYIIGTIIIMISYIISFSSSFYQFSLQNKNRAQKILR